MRLERARCAIDVRRRPSNYDESDVAGLLGDLRQLINEARERAAVSVNRELTMMHWHIGDRIRKDILHQQRADYGERIVHTLSGQLTNEFGHGFRSPLVSVVQHYFYPKSRSGANV